MRVANLINFSWICLRKDFCCFSSSLNVFLSSFDNSPSFLAFSFKPLIFSERLMTTSISSFRFLNSSMLFKAFMASSLLIRFFKVMSSTLTNNALCQRLANSVAVVPLIAISNNNLASTCCMALPS